MSENPYKYCSIFELKKTQSYKIWMLKIQSSVKLNPQREWNLHSCLVVAQTQIDRQIFLLEFFQVKPNLYLELSTQPAFHIFSPPESFSIKSITKYQLPPVR